VADTRRIPVLDLLRGIAIVGTFASNAWLFAHPCGPAAWLVDSLDGTAASPVETFLRFLANGKFLALLTLLFGVGMELQFRSAARRGVRWPGRYLVRAAVLFVEGLLHYVFVFEFDVLIAYAVTSVIVAFLIGRSDRVATAWIAGVGALHVLVVGALTVALAGAPAEPGGPQPGSYLGQVGVRLDQFGLYRAELVLIVPSGIAMFLLGARLLRARAVAASEAGARIRRRLMAIGAVALPVNLATSFAGPDWFLLDRYVVAPLVALGLFGLVTTLVLRARREPGPVQRGMTAVGRTALSCYVLQNLVAAVLCASWGFGLAGTLADARPWWVVGLWAGVCGLFTLLATLWLRRFERGPLEIVLHRLYRPAPAATPVAGPG